MFSLSSIIPKVGGMMIACSYIYVQYLLLLNLSYGSSHEFWYVNTEFKFDDKFYNLIQVSQKEYQHCTSLEPLRIFNSSPVILPLRERGVMFFICNIPNYCCLGQKIVISVHEGSIEKPPSPSPSPSQVPTKLQGMFHAPFHSHYRRISTLANV